MDEQDNKQAPDEGLEDYSRRLFRDSLESMDGATRSRLTQARHRALDELNTARRWRSGWLPAGAVAASVLAVWLIVGVQPDGPGQQQLVVDDGMELLFGDEELDMLEDLEFYAWLDEQGALEELSGADGVG